MFKSPFSFEGRIRRTEYGLSYLIYIAGIVIISFLAELGGMAAVSALIIIPAFWFMIAQGAKRCHDRGNSGWFQLIPFYSLWMLFADSEPGMNEYGPNPKDIGNYDEIDEIGSQLTG